MTRQILYSSLTRISDLQAVDWATAEVDRDAWGNGDYVVGEVRNDSPVPMELADGRMTALFRGDRIVGALGRRAATLEAVGSYEDAGPDRVLQLLTGAGLLGRATSVSVDLPPLVEVAYRGHVVVDDSPVGMIDHAADAHTGQLEAPLVLIVGTSMSAGKTTTARFAIRALADAGLRVVGAKLTGAGRFKDILAMRDAGAAAVFDFVDAGLPSTVCGPAEYRRALAIALSLIAGASPDAVVVEAGASPQEPYNGDVLISVLGDAVRCRILSASDPYAVVGVREAFGWEPHLVTGPATNTTAAVALIERLTGLPAANILDSAQRPRLEAVLRETLGLDGS